MSLARVRTLVALLPYSLQEQVEGYARRVGDAVPEITAEAQVNLTPRQIDALIYLAGVRKLYAIVSSNYTVLQESARLLSSAGVEGVRIGGTDFSPGSPFSTTLARLHRHLTALLDNLGIPRRILLGSYTDLVRLVANGPE